MRVVILVTGEQIDVALCVFERSALEGRRFARVGSPALKRSFNICTMKAVRLELL